MFLHATIKLLNWNAACCILPADVDGQSDELRTGDDSSNPNLTSTRIECSTEPTDSSRLEGNDTQGCGLVFMNPNSTKSLGSIWRFPNKYGTLVY